MIKNGKYFVQPERTDENFKQLFARLASSGAGRPVDDQGFAEGPWTAEALADEISSMEGNEAGIEVRAVQTWLQDNDSGISSDNIKWLARIFGCGDPAAVSLWQVELSISRDRLAAQRRAKRKIEGAEQTRQTETKELPDGGSVPNQEIDQTPGSGNATPSLAMRADAMFSGETALVLPITVWGGLGVLWLLAYALGVHDVTYNATVGADKQVGFIWSPAWNVGDLVLLPILLMTSSRLLSAWKFEHRPQLVRLRASQEVASWQARVQSFSLPFKAIGLICFFLVFLIQWTGVYLLPLLDGRTDHTMIDWALVALLRPDVLSVDAAIFASFVAFVFSGLIYWLFFTALLLLYIICWDYAEISRDANIVENADSRQYAVDCGLILVKATFRCTILGILIALCMKLNSAYLISDAESISRWMLDDALTALGHQSNVWAWIAGSPSPFLTSFLLVFLICSLFALCLLSLKSTLSSLLDRFARPYLQRLLIKAIVATALLVVAYMSVGQFFGFSILLSLAVGLSLMSMAWTPAIPLQHHGKTKNHE